MGNNEVESPVTPEVERVDTTSAGVEPDADNPESEKLDFKTKEANNNAFAWVDKMVTSKTQPAPSCSSDAFLAGFSKEGSEEENEEQGDGDDYEYHSHYAEDRYAEDEDKG